MPNVLEFEPLEIDYIENGEEWENDPEAYVEAFKGHRKEFRGALNSTDLDDMVSQWETDTIYDVIESGSDLAFNKNQRRRISKACQREWYRRFPAVARASHGMVE